MTGVKMGWIGTGEMGARVVRRLTEQGYSMVVWNRTRSRAEPLAALGASVVESPAAVAEAADVVFTMLTDANAVREVVTSAGGVAGAMRPASILVDMSTIAPQASRGIADQVRDAGATMLAAPVSGGIGAVATGELSIMVSGDREAFERVEPVLATVGRRVQYMGHGAEALIMKIAINLSLAVQMLAFSEGVLLAERNGVDRADAVDAMVSSAIASPMVKQRGPAVLPGALPDPAWFNCRMMQKDLLLALELGRASGVHLPSTALVNEWMSACRGSGQGEEDFSVVFHVLGRLTGVAERLA